MPFHSIESTQIAITHLGLPTALQRIFICATWIHSDFAIVMTLDNRQIAQTDRGQAQGKLVQQFQGAGLANTEIRIMDFEPPAVMAIGTRL